VGKIIESGTIKNQHNNTDVGYAIFHGLNSSYANKADVEWLSFKLAIIAALKRLCKTKEEFRQKLKENQIQDWHWSWIEKSVSMATSDYEWFYFIAEDQVQGVCVIYHPKPSKIDSQNIFYVEYLAVAPWNRNNVLAARKNKGIGTALLKITLNYSITVLGYRPGFSLHSLPQATEYYEKIGMINFGPDKTKQNLPYLEMEQDSSRRFADE
jgi:hypothetical protein